MISTKNLKKLEQSARTKNSQAYVKMLDSINQQQGVFEGVLAVKASGIGVDLHGNGDFSLFHEAIKCLENNAVTADEHAQIKQLTFQASKLNTLFDQFRKLTHAELQYIPPSQRFIYSLGAFEFDMRVLQHNMRFQDGVEPYKIPYPAVSKQFGSTQVNWEELDREQQVSILEVKVQTICKAVGTWLFYGSETPHLPPRHLTLDPRITTYSFAYNALTDKYNTLYGLFEDWRFNDYIVQEAPDTRTLHFYRQDEDSLITKEMTNISEEKRRLANILRARRESQQIEISPATADLLPKAFLDRDEFVDWETSPQYFHIYPTTEEVGGVTMAEWFRAIACIRLVAKETPKLISLEIDHLFDIRTQEEWSRLFVRHGIRETSVATILENLTYAKTSEDLLDAPLIKIEDSYLLIPSICEHLHGAKTLASNFLRTKLNYDSIKGPAFENLVRDNLTQMGFMTTGIHYKDRNRKDDGEEYDCDVAFLLGDDLFLMELKSYRSPSTPRGFFEYRGKITKAIQQIKRTNQYYLDNMHLVARAFEKPEGWKPKKVYNLLGLANPPEKNEFVEGILITDIRLFNGILRQIPVRIRDEHNRVQNIIPKNHAWMFTGEVTSEKVITYLKNPYQHALDRMQIRILDQPVEYGDYTLLKKQVESKSRATLTGTEEDLRARIDELQNLADQIK